MDNNAIMFLQPSTYIVYTQLCCNCLFVMNTSYMVCVCVGLWLLPLFTVFQSPPVLVAGPVIYP